MHDRDLAHFVVGTSEVAVEFHGNAASLVAKLDLSNGLKLRQIVAHHRVLDAQLVREGEAVPQPREAQDIRIVRRLVLVVMDSLSSAERLEALADRRGLVAAATAFGPQTTEAAVVDHEIALAGVQHYFLQQGAAVVQVQLLVASGRPMSGYLHSASAFMSSLLGAPDMAPSLCLHLDGPIMDP